MRISDWSSDVCSSDLAAQARAAASPSPPCAPLIRMTRSASAGASSAPTATSGVTALRLLHHALQLAAVVQLHADVATANQLTLDEQLRKRQIGRASCRDRVCQYV